MVTEYTLEQLRKEAQGDIKGLECSEDHRGLTVRNIRLVIGNNVATHLSYEGHCPKHGYTVYRHMAI